jgi:hypothetical protein
MNRLYASLYASLAVVALGGWISLAPARAAPPTVTPSPGYDSRLQEQRTGPAVYQPDARYRRPVSRRRLKRMHDGPH